MRPNIAKFQSRLAGLVLGHGTKASLVGSILIHGLTADYNYACVGEGWDMHGEEHVNVQFPADVVADRTYPDPEGQWGSYYSMARAVEEKGLEAVLDELEQYLSSNGMDLGLMSEDELTDPNMYNLVILGPVPPGAIRTSEG